MSSGLVPPISALYTLRHVKTPSISTVALHAKQDAAANDTGRAPTDTASQVCEELPATQKESGQVAEWRTSIEGARLVVADLDTLQLKDIFDRLPGLIAVLSAEGETQFVNKPLWITQGAFMTDKGGGANTCTRKIRVAPLRLSTLQQTQVKRSRSSIVFVRWTGAIDGFKPSRDQTFPKTPQGNDGTSCSPTSMI